MAAKKQKTKGKIGLLIFLVIIIPLIVFAVLQQTNWLNRASGPSGQALTNLNSTSEMLSTINADGTMGPQTSYGNWSNSLPSFLKGKLVFAVIDPVPSTLPTQAQGKAKGLDKTITPKQKQENGPQTVTALNLTITKVEVHMAYQGKPGDKNDNQGGKPSTPSANSGQAVDHWETLNIITPTTLDLVSLAKTNDIAKLGVTDLAEGKYTEIRLYVSTANATLSNGTVVNLKILGKDNIVRIVHPFTITAQKTTTVTMDFDAQHSVIKAGSVYLLKPVIARLLEENQ